MFARIVVGVSGSDEGRDALRLAGVLAQLSGAEVLIAHVHPIDLYENAALFVSGGRTLEEESEELLAREAVLGPPGARTRTIASRSPARGLQEVVTDEEADLLVVGSSGRGPLGRILLGDDAKQAMHHAPCAVAVASRGYRDADPALRTIGVGYDGGAESRAALAAADELALTAGGRLRIIGAAAPPFNGVVANYPYPIDWPAYFGQEAERLRTEVDTAAAGARAPATGVVETGEPASVLAEASRDCDLLAVGSRHWGAVDRLLLGSTATALVGSAHCPLLAVPRRAEE